MAVQTHASALKPCANESGGVLELNAATSSWILISCRLWDDNLLSLMDVQSALCGLSVQAHAAERIPCVILRAVSLCGDFKNACRFLVAEVMYESADMGFGIRLEVRHREVGAARKNLAVCVGESDSSED